MATEKKLSLTKALSMLADGDTIHSFQGGIVWFGCDMDREEVVDAIRNHGASLVGKGDRIPFSNHKIVTSIQGRRTYIETKEKVSG